jgi:hypothetical protein
LDFGVLDVFFGGAKASLSVPINSNQVIQLVDGGIVGHGYL